MAVQTERINGLLADTRNRLDALTTKIAELERNAAQLRRDALATHGAVQVLEVLAAESVTGTSAEVVALPDAT